MKSYAMQDQCSRGRRYPEDSYDQARAIYDRDIDRVIHSRSFKRLAGKTQVITGRQSDHHRTRLTHSIEVATLCRSVAQRLELNPSLAACLGFCHDLGHPPLGHCGEEVLNEICQRYGDSFEHNRHTLTIVDEFEQKYATCPGLNLSYEVREGIVKHSAHAKPLADASLAEFEPDLHPPLEAQLIDYLDEVCYCYSDLDDALETGFIDLETDILASLDPFRELFESLAARYATARSRLVFNETLRRMMNQTVLDLIDRVRTEVEARGIETLADVKRAEARLVGYSEPMGEWIRDLKAFLRRAYYQHPQIHNSRLENVAKIRRLYELYDEDPGRLPSHYQELIRNGRLPRHRVIVYYIAGFTDFFFFQVSEKFGL